MGTAGSASAALVVTLSPLVFLVRNRFDRFMMVAAWRRLAACWLKRWSFERFCKVGVNLLQRGMAWAFCTTRTQTSRYVLTHFLVTFT